MKISRLKKVRLIDIKDLIIFIFLIPVGYLIKLFYRDIWLITERPDEAKDNGFWFFKYVHENNLHYNTFYIIKKESKDFNKLKDIAPNRIIYFGSLKHYLFYIIGKLHISAHVGIWMINPIIIRILERLRLINNKKVFLQHGVITDIMEWAFRDNASIDMFCCSSNLELNFVRENFGYENHQVVITGLCRFDNIYTCKTKKQILLMPTWRRYLKFNGKESIYSFEYSDYFKAYSNFLNNKRLEIILEKYGYELIFYPHYEMQPFINCFKVNNSRIRVANKNNYEIQTLLKESEILITDYSSVFFDFAYMKKPCIYYQFDYESFRKGHWKEGYFRYSKDTFGPVVYKEQELLDALKTYIQNNCQLEEEFINKINMFFEYHDQDNCKRVYEQILSLK